MNKIPVSQGAAQVFALPTNQAELSGTSASASNARESRELARTQVRKAMVQLLSTCLALPPQALHVSCQPGCPPQASLADHYLQYLQMPEAHPTDPTNQAHQTKQRAAQKLREIGLSISHESGWALFALAPAGLIGVDLVRVPQTMDDAELRRVASLYLPAHAQWPAGLDRVAARNWFARAWSLHEARLKCAGMALTEWSPELEATLTDMTVEALPLPATMPDLHAAVATRRRSA